MKMQVVFSIFLGVNKWRSPEPLSQGRHRCSLYTDRLIRLCYMHWWVQNSLCRLSQYFTRYVMKALQADPRRCQGCKLQVNHLPDVARLSSCSLCRLYPSFVVQYTNTDSIIVQDLLAFAGYTLAQGQPLQA